MSFDFVLRSIATNNVQNTEMLLEGENNLLKSMFGIDETE